MTTKTGQLRELQGKHQSLLRLVELSVALNSNLELNTLLQTITATATELLNCEAASILLYDEKKPRLFFAAATGSDPEKLAEIPVPIDNSLAGTIFRTNKPLIINNTAEQDPRHYSLVADNIKFKVEDLIGVPMNIKNKTVGVLEAVNRNNGNFDEADVETLSVIASHAAIAIENARLLKTTQQALKKVKETNEIKSNFLALASHELRTPLGIIMGYGGFLQETAKGESSEHIQQVLGAAEQMRSLLDQMSNLTLLQTDEMTMNPIRVSIQDILNFAVDEIKYSASRRDLSLTYAFQDAPIFINVDQEKTILAFVNILNNAVRFSNHGGEITVGAVQQNNEVLAWVNDKGKGIPVDKLEKIFEEFYQIEPPNTRSYGGLGIGLSIAKGLIETQGGKIWAESEGLGKGTTMKVVFPLQK
jgi:signal transduction histidine kinase